MWSALFRILRSAGPSRVDLRLTIFSWRASSATGHRDASEASGCPGHIYSRLGWAVHAFVILPIMRSSTIIRADEIIPLDQDTPAIEDTLTWSIVGLFVGMLYVYACCGPALVLTMWSSFYGIMLSQTYEYFCTYRKDGKFVKSIVAVLMYVLSLSFLALCLLKLATTIQNRRNSTLCAFDALGVSCERRDHPETAFIISLRSHRYFYLIENYGNADAYATPTM